MTTTISPDRALYDALTLAAGKQLAASDQRDGRLPDAVDVAVRARQVVQASTHILESVLQAVLKAALKLSPSAFPEVLASIESLGGNRTFTRKVRLLRAGTATVATGTSLHAAAWLALVCAAVLALGYANAPVDLDVLVSLSSRTAADDVLDRIERELNGEPRIPFGPATVTLGPLYKKLLDLLGTTPTGLASADAWARSGYQPRPGTGIRILVRSPSADGVSLHLKRMYHSEDVEPVTAQGDAGRLLKALNNWAVGNGLTVMTPKKCPISGDTIGMYTPATRSIAVCPTDDVGRSFTLAHELAHHLTRVSIPNSDSLPEATRELIAEVTAAAVVGAAKVRPGQDVVAYLHDHGGKLEDLRRYRSVIEGFATLLVPTPELAGAQHANSFGSTS